MRTTIITGVLLIIIGVALLFQYSYTTRENVFQLGPIHATADKTHVVSAPPPLSWAFIGGGIVILAFGAIRKR